MYEKSCSTSPGSGFKTYRDIAEMIQTTVKELQQRQTAVKINVSTILTRGGGLDPRSSIFDAHRNKPQKFSSRTSFTGKAGCLHHDLSFFISTPPLALPTSVIDAFAGSSIIVPRRRCLMRTCAIFSSPYGYVYFYLNSNVFWIVGSTIFFI